MQRCRSSRAAGEQQRRHGKSCSSSYVRLCLSKMGKATSSWFPPFSSSSSSSSAFLFSPPAAEAEAGATAAAAKRKAWSGGGCSSTGAATAAAAECDEEKSGKLMLLNPRVSRRSLLFKFLTMAFLFLLAVAGLVNFYFHLPGLSGKTRAELAQLLPSSWRESGKLRQLETVRGVFRVFAEYKAMHPWSTWFFLCCCYLLYQAFPFFTFTFPGTATVVTLLLGALYPAHVAFITANALAAIGPSAAYFIIWFVGKPLVSFMFADKLEKLSRLLRAKGRTQQQRQQKSSSKSSNGSSTNSRSVNSNGGCVSGEDVCGAVRISSGAEEDISIRGREGEAAAARSSSSRTGGRRGLKRSSSRSRSCTSSRSGSSTRSNGSRKSNVKSRSSKGRISRRSTRRGSSGGSSNPHQALHTEESCPRTRLEERGRHGGGKEEFERGGKRQQRSVVTAEQKREGKEKQEEDAAVEAATAALAAPLLPRLLKEEKKDNKEQREKEQQPKRESKSRPLQTELRKSSKRFDVDLFLTMLFLRVSPVFPNLVITAAAPLLGVPFDVFFYATLLGLMPNTAVFVSMGSTLSSLDSLYGSWKLWGLLCVMGGAVLLLKIMRQRLGAIEHAALELKGGDEEMQEEN